MLIFRTGGENLVASLQGLVQAWLVAERTNHRLVIDWPDLPTDRLQLRPFFDYQRNLTTGAIEYVASQYPGESNKHLLQYYYRRIFTQIFLLRYPTILPYAHKHVVLWGAESFPHWDTVNRHHWCKTKLVYRFSAETVVPQDELLPCTENWSTFLHLAACTVIVGRHCPWLDTLVQCFRNKEHWVVIPVVPVVASEEPSAELATPPT